MIDIFFIMQYLSLNRTIIIQLISVLEMKQTFEVVALIYVHLNSIIYKLTPIFVLLFNLSSL